MDPWSMDPWSMDPVHILMDPVHGLGPRRGSMDPWSMFCTFPEPTVLARRASYDKKTLARQVIPLAPGYRIALSLCPVMVGKAIDKSIPVNKIS